METRAAMIAALPRRKESLRRTGSRISGYKILRQRGRLTLMKTKFEFIAMAEVLSARAVQWITWYFRLNRVCITDVEDIV